MARPRQVTSEQIVDAMRQAVLEKGSQVSLDTVAHQLGVTSPALIKRFGSREALLIEALRPDERELEALFPAPASDRPFAVQLELLIDRLSQYFMTALPRVMTLRGCGISDDVIHRQIKQPMPVRAVAGATRWLEEMNRLGLIRSEVVATAATAIVGAVTTRMLSAYLSRRPWSRRSQAKYQKELAGLFDVALHGRGVPQISPGPARRGAEEAKAKGEAEAEAEAGAGAGAGAGPASRKTRLSPRAKTSPRTSGRTNLRRKGT